MSTLPTTTSTFTLTETRTAQGLSTVPAMTDYPENNTTTISADEYLKVDDYWDDYKDNSTSNNETSNVGDEPVLYAGGTDNLWLTLMTWFNETIIGRFYLQ